MNYLITIFFFIFLHTVSSGQDISNKYPGLIQRVAKINQDSSMEKVVMINEEFMPQMTDGGGELVGYFIKGQIQRITRKIGLSYGIETYDYYFEKGALIFIYETLDGFLYLDSLNSADYTKTETNFIGRYYFRNKKLIDNETTGHNRFENDDLDMEKTLLTEVNECLNKVLRQRNQLNKN